MSDSLNNLMAALTAVIDERAEAKALEILRAIGIPDGGQVRSTDEPLLTPIETAQMLGYDTSTAEAQEKARQKIYYLVNRGYIKGVWLSKRNLRINPSVAREYIKQGGNKKTT